MSSRISRAAQLLGKRGGAKNSPAQLAAKAANGRLGGRPRRYRLINGQLERRQGKYWLPLVEPYDAAAKAYLRRNNTAARIKAARIMAASIAPITPDPENTP